MMDVGTQRLSKTALASFICGILGCLPFVTGVLAVVLGIVGMARTGKAGVRGRWMAVVGLVLGAVSLVAWSGASLVGGGVWAIIKGTEGPRIAAHDFIRDAAAGDAAAAQAKATGMTEGDVGDIITALAGHGTFRDTTFNSTSITNSSGHVAGVAMFSGGDVNVTADLESIDGAWKVRRMVISPR